MAPRTTSWLCIGLIIVLILAITFIQHAQGITNYTHNYYGPITTLQQGLFLRIFKNSQISHCFPVFKCGQQSVVYSGTEAENFQYTIYIYRGLLR